MAVLLWTYLPTEVLQPLDTLVRQIQRDGHVVYSLDLDGSLARWGSRTTRITPDPRETRVRFPDLMRQWEPVIAAGFAPQDPRSPAAKYARLEEHALTILDWIRPDAVCVWNPMAPNFGILGEIAARRGMHCTYTERGVIPGTVVIDPRGLFRHARYRIANAEVDDAGTAMQVGLRLLGDLDPAKTVRRDGARVRDEAYETFLQRHRARTVVVIFGSPPHEHRIVPSAWVAGKSSLPLCGDYQELLTHLLEALPDHAFVFKPHPHARRDTLPASDRLLVTDVHPLQLLTRSAAAIAHGSSLELTTVLRRVPLLLAGNGHLWETDAAVSCHSVPSLVQALHEVRSSGLASKAPSDWFTMHLGSYVMRRVLFAHSTATDRAIFYGDVPLQHMTRTTMVRQLGIFARRSIGLLQRRIRRRLRRWSVQAKG